jgi:hypothetical protein
MEVTMSVKIDPKRERHQLFSAHQRPELIVVPELTYLMIDGHGDPNVAAEYRAAIEALYGLSFALKFAIKRTGGPDYTVAPLEGLWWADDLADFSLGNKSHWDWTMMIMQPGEVTHELYERTAAEVAAKKGSAANQVRLEHFEEGQAAQILYIGPYSDEGPSIRRLHAFIDEHGYQKRGKHHEIYLGDPRRTKPERLKTIIRQPVGARLP